MAADEGAKPQVVAHSQPVNSESAGVGVGRPTGRARRSAAAPSAGASDDGEGSGAEDDSASIASGPQQEPDQLYDEAADEKDAAWVDRQRAGRISDAVLSCPGCFTTLCIDCQRHEQYHQQYRAMFVMNCQVDDEAVAGEDFDPASPGGGSRPAGRRPKRAKPSSQYRRVRCGVCRTEVGALDAEEELYHFYHVFPSNA